jgi:hypothetical protein
MPKLGLALLAIAFGCVQRIYAQGITFADSVFQASPFRAETDAATQQVLDEVNNLPFSPVQKRRFDKHCFNEINFFKRTIGFGNTYFENEKAAYPHAMHSLIWGLGKNEPSFIAPSKGFLQSPAIYDLGSVLTDTLDFFPSFTLKGQVPKYFYFGKYLKILDSSYLAKMRKGAYLWTHNDTLPTDPMLRPNPFFLGNSGCWDPRCRNSWVDSRNTDNLKAMRETSVYLFSEEIGNEPIRDLYFNRLRHHVGALWHTGYSEWDSETYVPHAIAPFFNLFAFTKNPAARRIAKAGLDWYFMAAALKYFYGMSTGPSKRSNGSANVRLGASAADMPYLYFGDSEVPEAEIFDRDRDSYIQFLSQYRPPQVLYQLASKQFHKPMELRATKPPYGTFTATSAGRPDAFETMYFGKTYQMGSVVSGFAVSDMRPYKLGALHPTRGVDVFYANTTDNDTLTHAKYANDQIGQFENLMVFIRKNGGRRFFFQVPMDVPFDTVSGFWFFPYAKTWIAVRPLNIKVLSILPLNGIYANHQEILCETPPSGFSGFAMEVADEDEYATYDDFKNAIYSRQLEILHFQDSGMVRLEGKNGKFLKVKYNPLNQRPEVYRNSNQATDFLENNQYNVYQGISPPVCKLDSLTYDGQNLNISLMAKDTLWGPVMENWKRGIVKILTNDHYFEGKYEAGTGQYYWKALPATPELRKGKISKVELFANGNVVQTWTDSLQINTGNLSLSFPSGQSGNFAFQFRVWDEEGNESRSEIVNLNIVALERKIKAEEFRLFPNPAETSLEIELPQNQGVFTLLLPDGKVIKSENCLSTKTNWNLNSLTSGLYFLRWQSGNQSLIKPFVKK